jgi:hypothetical protein
MSSRSVSDIQTRAEGESLYIRYRSDANVLSYEKIKAEVYVNQDKSLSDLQTLIKHSFLLYFPRELLMNFLNTVIIDALKLTPYLYSRISKVYCKIQISNMIFLWRTI